MASQCCVTFFLWSCWGVLDQDTPASANVTGICKQIWIYTHDYSLPHLLHGKTRCFHPPALFAVEGCFEAAFREGYHTFELVCAFAISALGSDFGDFKLLSSRLYRKISCLF